jgi:hypothetical protein
MIAIEKTAYKHVFPRDVEETAGVSITGGERPARAGRCRPSGIEATVPDRDRRKA